MSRRNDRTSDAKVTVGNGKGCYHTPVAAVAAGSRWGVEPPVVLDFISMCKKYNIFLVFRWIDGWMDGRVARRSDPACLLVLWHGCLLVLESFAVVLLLLAWSVLWHLVILPLLLLACSCGALPLPYGQTTANLHMYLYHLIILLLRTGLCIDSRRPFGLVERLRPLRVPLY